MYSHEIRRKVWICNWTQAHTLAYKHTERMYRNTCVCMCLSMPSNTTFTKSANIMPMKRKEILFRFLTAAVVGETIWYLLFSCVEIHSSSGYCWFWCAKLLSVRYVRCLSINRFNLFYSGWHKNSDGVTTIKMKSKDCEINVHVCLSCIKVYHKKCRLWNHLLLVRDFIGRFKSLYLLSEISTPKSIP